MSSTDNFDLIHTVIEKLQPDFTDYTDDKLFHHWCDYACALDEIQMVYYKDEKDLPAFLNGKMKALSSNTPMHEACVDVATTIENLLPKYKGVFVYE